MGEGRGEEVEGGFGPPKNFGVAPPMIVRPGLPITEKLRSSARRVKTWLRIHPETGLTTRSVSQVDRGDPSKTWQGRKVFAISGWQSSVRLKSPRRAAFRRTFGTVTTYERWVKCYARAILAPGRYYLRNIIDRSQESVNR